MEKKIIKFQLYALFILTFLNIVYFSLHDSLPDNYFEISYQNNSVSLFSYYTSTVLAHFGYWCGLWVSSAFIGFALINTLLLAKKHHDGKASFIALFSTLTCFCLCYLILPFSLGEGLFSFIEDYVGAPYVFLTFTLSSFTLFYLISEDKFFSFFKSLYQHILNTPDHLKRFDFAAIKSFKFSNPFNKAVLEKSFTQKVKDARQPRELKRPTVAKAVTEAENIQPSFMSGVSSAFDNVTKKFDSLVASDVLEVAASQVVEELPENFNDSDSFEDLDSIEETAYIRPKKADTFFNADELISCIAPQHSDNVASDPDDSYFVTIASAIEAKLLEFNIRSNVINVLKGPVVDTFELELGAGVKVAGVTNRTDDLSLALMGAPIRMVYPMKGKSTIGIEVPRNPRDLIYLDEVLKSDVFLSSNLRLPIAMGKDAYGDAAVIDLASTPHLLVAGTTGAGKSVFINTMLVSLIIKLSPKKLRLIMIDPKQLELALYQTLPHLIMPVITDPQIASVSLLWAIDEMERRYSLLKDFAVKNIEGFNKKIKVAGHELLCKINKYYEDVDAMDYEMPYIVIVVDEFADLVLSKSGKAIENSISRLAAKARASGIHIVLATQRPSTDVITGVIKANFPTRVSFRVTTNMDSRVVLDTMGAEKLLGKGDMLFKQGIETLRMHSAYVDEEEIESLVEKLATIPSEFDASAVEFIENNGSAGDEYEAMDMDGDSARNGGKDEKYDEAVRIVATHRMASASFLQRRLGVGYNRAANLIEEMERKGVVGPAQGSKPRKVLVAPME